MGSAKEYGHSRVRRAVAALRDTRGPYKTSVATGRLVHRPRLFSLFIGSQCKPPALLYGRPRPSTSAICQYPLGPTFRGLPLAPHCRPLFRAFRVQPAFPASGAVVEGHGAAAQSPSSGASSQTSRAPRANTRSRLLANRNPAEAYAPPPAGRPASAVGSAPPLEFLRPKY